MTSSFAYGNTKEEQCRAHKENFVLLNVSYSSIYTPQGLRIVASDSTDPLPCLVAGIIHCGWKESLDFTKRVCSNVEIIVKESSLDYLLFYCSGFGFLLTTGYGSVSTGSQGAVFAETWHIWSSKDMFWSLCFWSQLERICGGFELKAQWKHQIELTFEFYIQYTEHPT